MLEIMPEVNLSTNLFMQTIEEICAVSMNLMTTTSDMQIILVQKIYTVINVQKIGIQGIVIDMAE